MERKMKDSGIPWLGMIPSEWEICRFKNFITQVATPSTFKKKVGLENIESETGHFIQTEAKFDGNGVQFAINDILYGKLRPYLKKVWLSTFEGNAVGDFHVFRTKPNSYANYVKWLLLSEGFTEAVNSSVYGAKMPRVSSEFIMTLPFFLPPLPTQQRIADFLDRKCAEIDELATLQETMIAELKRYKQSVITEAVTKGLDPDVPMKDSGVEWIGEIPEGWGVCRLKDILKRPLQYGANESGIPFNDELPRYVRITDISDNTLREDLIKQSLSEEQAVGYILENNDILFARSGGTVGKAFIYKQEYGRCAFAGYLIKATIQKSDARYVYYYTQTHCYEEWKRRIFIQATIQNIGADRYSIMEISAPQITDQRAIADYLDKKCAEIDELVAIKQQKIEALKEYKKSVIFEYVTGKKEVEI